MPDNDLVNIPSQPPLPPWAKGQPLAHERLNDMQAKPVYDVVVRGEGARTVRSGTTVAILLAPPVAAPPILPLLHIISSAGFGQYVCREVTPPTSWNSATSLAAASYGTDGDTDVLLVNWQENEAGTNDLDDADNTLQRYLVPDRRAPFKDQAGRTVYEVNAFWWALCDDEGTEGPQGPPGDPGADGTSIGISEQNTEPVSWNVGDEWIEID